MKCKRCGSEQVTKNGKVRGKHRFLCNGMAVKVSEELKRVLALLVVLLCVCSCKGNCAAPCYAASIMTAVMDVSQAGGPPPKPLTQIRPLPEECFLPHSTELSKSVREMIVKAVKGEAAEHQVRFERECKTLFAMRDLGETPAVINILKLTIVLSG